eukprot:TRINITY_DN66525_c7_g7_i1.p1 TRINITY_DN66525_c7_g7~~TRINITY_DN66525_c7_g7_i1.p1  ORF type:complete len:411 (-),score=217.17 TRINITY_DN66525_c7_g7_i1:319-1551(-)
MTSTTTAASVPHLPQEQTPAATATSQTNSLTQQQQQLKKKKKKSFKSQPKPTAVSRLKHAAAGSCGGLVAKTILQPLDLVRTRMQVHDGRGQRYSGVVDAFRSIYRSGGVAELYQGLGANLLGSGVSWGVYFYTYNTAKDYFKHSRADPTQPLTPLHHMASAASAGAMTVMVTNPIWMVKTRLQLQTSRATAATAAAAATTGSGGAATAALGAGQPHAYGGVFDAFRSIVREEGALALYRGVAPALTLVSNGALQFMAYEELRRLCIKHWVGTEDDIQPWQFLAMGGTAKAFSSTVTYPLQVTRARLYQRAEKKPQATTAATTTTTTTTATASTSTSVAGAAPKKKKMYSSAKYNGMLDVMRHIVRQEGYRGFYKGLKPHLLKTAPSSAITFLAYESILRVLNRIIEDDD